MTKFNHAKRSGRSKRPKERERQSLGIRSLEALVAHRELEYLRNPTSERMTKLSVARTALAEFGDNRP